MRIVLILAAFTLLSACASQPKQKGRGIQTLNMPPIPKGRCPANKVCKPCPGCTISPEDEHQIMDDGTVDVYGPDGSYMGFGETAP